MRLSRASHHDAFEASAKAEPVECRRSTLLARAMHGVVGDDAFPGRKARDGMNNPYT